MQLCQGVDELDFNAYEYASVLEVVARKFVSRWVHFIDCEYYDLVKPYWFQR